MHLTPTSPELPRPRTPSPDGERPGRRLILSGGAIVLPDRVLEDSSVVLEGGLIADVVPHAFPACRDVFRFDGRLVLPGLVDLHNDALENEINPRPRTGLPAAFALSTLDRRLAACGVTTELHAIFFADLTRNDRQLDLAPERARGVRGFAQGGGALVDHRPHLRVDIWLPASAEIALALASELERPLISLNDHTPGQGQFKDVESFAAYLRDHLGWTDTAARREARAMVEQARDHAEIRAEILDRIAAAARERPIILASHDDDTPDKVDEMWAVGARIGEFPVTFAAAERQRSLGMAIVAGAPNVVRGGSASGNISALALIERGLVDILCADYHAPSMLFATLKLAGAGLLSLPEATRLVTCNPARAIGAEEIGTIEPGRQADLIVVNPRTIPTVELLIRRGAARYHTPDVTPREVASFVSSRTATEPTAAGV
jgi:alpha-D-ribose 1-methylphosphonate 5-triphosphate diphosphatase